MVGDMRTEPAPAMGTVLYGLMATVEVVGASVSGFARGIGFDLAVDEQAGRLDCRPWNGRYI